MIKKLKATIEKLQETNRLIAQQLMETNEMYSQLMAMLGIDGDSQPECSEKTENHSAVTGSNDLSENSVDVNDGMADGEFAEEPQDGDTEKKLPNDEEMPQPEATFNPEELMPGITSVKTLIDELEQMANAYDSFALDNNVSEIKEGYENFVKILNTGDITKLLLRELTEYGWCNRMLRLYAYSQTDSFKFAPLKKSLTRLYETVNDLCASRNILLELPMLAIDDFDSSKHSYNNESTRLVDNYCSIPPTGGKIYDIIQVGYTISDAENLAQEYIAPEVFYY